MVNMNEVSQRLSEERKRLELTMAELGRRIGKGSQRSQALWNWENNHRIPRADDLVRLYEAGVDVGYVLTGRRLTSTNNCNRKGSGDGFA